LRKRARLPQPGPAVHILHAEEDHIDFIETQFDLIARIGVPNWMQLNRGAAE
jgi:bacterioferritin